MPSTPFYACDLKKIETNNTKFVQDILNRGRKLVYPMVTKIHPSYFFEARPELLTGEETPLDMLLGSNVLNYDIQQHIQSFLEDEPEHPYLCNPLPEAYLSVFDSLNNESFYPIESDEKHCFETIFEDDFVVD